MRIRYYRRPRFSQPSYYAGSRINAPGNPFRFPSPIPPSGPSPPPRFPAESNRADRSLHLSLGCTIKCRKLRRKCYNEYIVTRISELSPVKKKKKTCPFWRNSDMIEKLINSVSRLILAISPERFFKYGVAREIYLSSNRHYLLRSRILMEDSIFDY